MGGGFAAGPERRRHRLVRRQRPDRRRRGHSALHRRRRGGGVHPRQRPRRLGHAASSRGRGSNARLTVSGAARRPGDEPGGPRLGLATPRSPPRPTAPPRRRRRSPGFSSRWREASSQVERHPVDASQVSKVWRGGPPHRAGAPRGRREGQGVGHPRRVTACSSPRRSRRSRKARRRGSPSRAGSPAWPPPPATCTRTRTRGRLVRHRLRRRMSTPTRTAQLPDLLRRRPEGGHGQRDEVQEGRRGARSTRSPITVGQKAYVEGWQKPERPGGRREGRDRVGLGLLEKWIAIEQRESSKTSRHEAAASAAG